MKQIEEDFFEVLKKYNNLLKKYCFFYAHDIMTFEDLYQEVVYNLWKNFNKRKKCGETSTWVYRVTINTCMTFMRLKYKHIMTKDVSLALKIPDDISDNLRDDYETIYKMIEKLSFIDRTIVLLWMDGKSYHEIAETVGMSDSNIGSRLHRIKIRLKKYINQINKSI